MLKGLCFRQQCQDLQAAANGVAVSGDPLEAPRRAVGKARGDAADPARWTVLGVAWRTRLIVVSTDLLDDSNVETLGPYMEILIEEQDVLLPHSKVMLKHLPAMKPHMKKFMDLREHILPHMVVIARHADELVPYMVSALVVLYTPSCRLNLCEGRDACGQRCSAAAHASADGANGRHGAVHGRSVTSNENLLRG